MDSQTARGYFSQLDAYLADSGFESLEALRNRAHRIEGGTLIYVLVLGLLGVAATLLMDAAALPVLMKWMVLVLFGVVLTVLGILYRWRQRRRLAQILRAWEEEHPLRPVARSLYEQVAAEELPQHVRWLLRRRSETALDWMQNYSAALSEVREALHGHGHAGAAASAA